MYVAGTNDIWFRIRHLFLVTILYGLASGLLAYNVSSWRGVSWALSRSLLVVKIGDYTDPVQPEQKPTLAVLSQPTQLP